MKAFGERADPLQSASQKSGKVRPQSRLRQASALERGLMVARQNPGLVGNARSVRSNRHIIAARLNHTRRLPLLLGKNVAENAALFGHEIFTPRAQLVKHSPRHEHRGGNLRRGMAELLPGVRAVILEETNVLDPRIKYVSLFKDYGPNSGQEFSHPTSQITATMFVPRRVLYELRAGREYFVSKERCVFCDILTQEERQASRVIEARGDYV